MAYSVTIPPRLIAQSLGGGGKLWMYKSADAESAFDDTDYITDALELGMATGDVVIAIDTTNNLTSICQVTLDADGNGTLTPLTAIT